MATRAGASLLPGARLIEPAAQGDYDGLCGLYCIINAIRLVLAPRVILTDEEVRLLFATGVRFLSRRGSLASAVRSCVPERDWPKLAARVVEAAQTITDRPISIERPRVTNDAPVGESLRLMEAFVGAGKAPCVFLRGRYRHYTVISGYTDASLKLFDSFGYRWVRRGSFRPGARRSPHRLHLQSLITLASG